MTWQIIRDTVQTQIVRQISKVQVGTKPTFQILRSASGPRGQPAGQDIQFAPLTGGFAPGEIIKGGRVAHATNCVVIYVETSSGVEQAQTITIQQARAGSVIGSANFTLNPGDSEIEAVIPDPGLAFAIGDQPRIAMPDPADPQLTDLTVTIGSIP